MDGKSQTPRDGKHACPHCVRVFSSLKAVHGHQRMHKSTANNNSPLPPPPPPPKNPYDGHEAFVYPGEESEEEEEEEGDITSDDGSQCARKNGSSPEAIEIKMEDFPPDFFEAAATLLTLQYASAPRGVFFLSSDSNDPQENPKTKLKARVNPQTSVAVPKQENGTGSSSSDGGRVFECNRCQKKFGTQQALGGHMAGHKNTDRKAAAMAEAGTPSASQIVKEHKCESCGATFDSGQALGGHMRKHRALANWRIDDDDGTTVVVVKKEVAEDDEDIHERNNDHKRIRLTLDLNHEPIDIEDD